MSRQELLAKLPAAQGLEETIVEKQTVRDIVKEVLKAHELFAPDYDLICEDFEGPYTLDRLFKFCKANLVNDTESEELQTTSSPTVLLERGHCDCKGYAGFIAGILDGLNRAGADKYNWCYRFAEYDDIDFEGKKTVHYHVFIVVNPGGQETWIDPVLATFNSRDPYPDRYFDKKISSMTLVRLSGVHNGMGGGPVGGPFPVHTVVTPEQLQAAGERLAVITAATDAAIAAATSAGMLPFKEAGAGLQLPSIPGYPPDLPTLQLSPSGRLCFYSFPLAWNNPIWHDMGSAGEPPISHAYSSLDWNGTYLKIATLETITQEQYNALKALYNDNTYPFDFAVYNTSPGMAAGWYKIGHPYAWIWANVQYYINKFLKNPYGVNDYISYGTNWAEQFKNAVMSGTAKLTTYLEGCSFLVQPVGTQTFWDKFYLAAPLVISAIAAIVTEGAATPALLLAISNLAVKAGEAKAASDAAAALPPQGAPVINVPVVKQEIQDLTGGGSGGTISDLMTWIKANPLEAGGIGLLVLFLMYELIKDD